VGPVGEHSRVVFIPGRLPEFETDSATSPTEEHQKNDDAHTLLAYRQPVERLKPFCETRLYVYGKKQMY
jgi:hypothetical protein